MSIAQKFTLTFSLLILVILIINNTILYVRYKEDIIAENNERLVLLSNLIGNQMETIGNNVLYMDDLFGKKLRLASIAIKNSLPPAYENVTNSELKKLADELFISNITLFAKKDGDIIGVKSTIPEEIHLSTKDWGIWRDALEQLMDKQAVNVGIGLSLPHYWSGPVEVSGSNPELTGKWGYYYDGETDYIIKPHLEGLYFYEYMQRFGPDKFFQDIHRLYDGYLEFTVYNPEHFGKTEKITTTNQQSYVRLTDRPLFAGTYHYKNIKQDMKFIRKALSTDQFVSYRATINNKEVIKSFIAKKTNTNIPYVIGITYDYSKIRGKLNKKLDDYFETIVIFFFLVILIALFFCENDYEADISNFEQYQ